ncbi:MAG: 1-acyl-sn-glycerol-3-phosphate acyltransferase [Planctomycetota bacterium]|jgi:1-acyl-sn-glycerol-3-phosphate acyltransferase
MKSLRILLHVLIIRPLLHLLFGVNVVGRENLEGIDKFIIVANHNSHLDIFLLYLILPLKKICQTHPVAALDYFSKPGWLFKAMCLLFQPIWLNRGEKSISIIREMQRRLDEGHNIIIFPEGTRGESGEIKDFYRGVGLTARKNPDVAVIPVFLEGPERVFPKKALFPLPLWNHITVGPPQIIRGKSRDITAKLHKHLITLAEEEQSYRQRRISEPRKPFAIAFIGIDGSGKSTLSRHLIKLFKGESCFISDGLELFNNGESYHAQPLIVNELRQWIGRKAKKAQNLSRYKIPKLAELLLRDRLLTEVQRWYRPEQIIIDGSPLLNMTAWAVLFHEECFNEEVCAKALDVLTGRVELAKNDRIFTQLPELNALRKLHLNHLHLPDAVVFLDVEPKVSIERIKSRGQTVQAHENEQKLTKLSKAYHVVCDVLEKTIPVYRLSGDNDLELLAQQTYAFAKEVRED